MRDINWCTAKTPAAVSECRCKTKLIALVWVTGCIQLNESHGELDVLDLTGQIDVQLDPYVVAFQIQTHILS